jgi:hypothetical protein
MDTDVWNRMTSGILLFCKSLKRHAMPLLHINQQIRAEVIDFVLQKLGQRIDDAKVDVIYRIETKWGPSTLWATWLSAPFPTYHLHTLHAQIRQFQVFQNRDFSTSYTCQPHGGFQGLDRPWKC